LLGTAEDLLKALKVRAVNERKTFKTLVTELFRKGLAVMEVEEVSTGRGRKGKWAL
jgi:hypothetical protein